MKTYAIMPKIESKDIRACRRKMGLTQAEFASLVNTSKKTVERWESSNIPIRGPIVLLVKLLNEYPQIEEDYNIPQKEYSMRLWYMCQNEVCTIIDVEESMRKLKIYNYTNNPLMRAFGKIEKPTFEQYEQFLESRCFPRTRDKMKLMLKELDLPFYDPFMIIEKTEGRMADDEFWIRIER